MSKLAHIRHQTFRCEEVEIDYSQMFVWESDDGLGDGFVGAGDILIEGFRVFGHRMPLLGISKEAKAALISMADKDAREWTE